MNEINAYLLKFLNFGCKSLTARQESLLSFLAFRDFRAKFKHFI